MKLTKLQIKKIIREEIGKLNQQPSDLAQELSRLYDEILALPRKYKNRYVAIDDEAMDEEMERIVRRSATPEQKKSGAYIFAFGSHPKWERLNDTQLAMLKPFLETVLKDEEFSGGGKWTGSTIEYPKKSSKPEEPISQAQAYRNYHNRMVQLGFREGPLLPGKVK